MVNNEFRIYVLEDDEWYNKLLVHSLSLNPDFIIKSFFNADDFLKSLKDKPNVVTIDYRLPDATGEQVLEKIKSVSPETEVIVVSEQENIETAVNLIRLGAYDYLVKEKNIRDRLLSIVNKIRSNVTLKEKVSSLEKELQKA